MAATLVTIAPKVIAAGVTTSSPFTVPQTTDTEVVIVFNVQQPDVADPTKTASCELNDLTTGSSVAGFTGWQGGGTDKNGNPAVPGFGVADLQSLIGHSLQFVLTLGASLNTGVTITTN